MMKVNLNSGAVLDAHEIEVGQHTIELIDRNGDTLNKVGQPLVESIEAI